MAVGKLSGGIVDNAADLAALGLDPLYFIRTTDSLERSLIIEIANRLVERREIQDRNLAVAIVKEVGNLIKR